MESIISVFVFALNESISDPTDWISQCADENTYFNHHSNKINTNDVKGS